MSSRVSQVMTRDPVALEFNAPLTDAAEAMRQRDIGNVIVVKNGAVFGILTDRDIVVRGLVDGRNPALTPIGEICSQELNTLVPESKIDDAVQMMRAASVRRLPVLEDGQIVGVVTIGDLARDRDKSSALASISAARANH